MTTKLPPLDPALLDLPDDQLGLQLYAQWIVDKAAEKGISQDQLTPELAEIFRETMLGSDTDNEDLAGVEKALHLIAGGSPGSLARGGRMLRAHLVRRSIAIAALDEAKTGRRRQQANAKKPRGGALQGLIVDIIRAKPSMSERDLYEALEARGGIIVSVSDQEIVYLEPDKRGRETRKTAKTSGLPDRMSRARRFLSQ